jgi:hypothetical protein
VKLQPVAVQKPRLEVEQSWAPRPAKEQTQIAASEMFRDFPEEAPRHADYSEFPEEAIQEPHDSSGGLTTLLSRYFTGETSGSERGVVYH